MIRFKAETSARTARGGREAPAPWGGGTGAARAPRAFPNAHLEKPLSRRLGRDRSEIPHPPCSDTGALIGPQGSATRAPGRQTMRCPIHRHAPRPTKPEISIPAQSGKPVPARGQQCRRRRARTHRNPAATPYQAPNPPRAAHRRHTDVLPTRYRPRTDALQTAGKTA